METHLFEWESVDLMSEISYIYYDCTIQQPFGPYSKGDRVSSIYLNYAKAKIEVYETKDAEPTWSGKLKLRVAQEEKS